MHHAEVVRQYATDVLHRLLQTTMTQPVAMPDGVAHGAFAVVVQTFAFQLVFRADCGLLCTQPCHAMQSNIA
jgi:hypothetical protein